MNIGGFIGSLVDITIPLILGIYLLLIYFKKTKSNIFKKAPFIGEFLEKYK